MCLYYEGKRKIIMRYLSFAQDYEDIILYSSLEKYVQKGFYVDIGANDPCIISVTKFFYDRGWRGLNIEPLDDMYKLLCDERHEDLNINVGISDKNGELKLQVNGEMSSFCNNKDDLNKMIKSVKRFEDIWEEINFKNKINEVHFCKIDVEGYEKNVLKSMNFKTFRPWIFCIESTLPGTSIPCFEEWENILLSNGYLYAYQYGINRYYVEEKKKFLIDGLVNFKEMFKNNQIWRVFYQNNYMLNKRWLDRYGKFVIFGAGYYMQNFIDMYGEQYKPVAIVDNNGQKQGMSFMGLEVKRPDVLKEYDNVTVLICCAKTDEIKNQLKTMGIKNYRCYNYVQDKYR